jgi:hypothetical protein
VGARGGAHGVELRGKVLDRVGLGAARAGHSRAARAQRAQHAPRRRDVEVGRRRGARLDGKARAGRDAEGEEDGERREATAPERRRSGAARVTVARRLGHGLAASPAARRRRH